MDLCCNTVLQCCVAMLCFNAAVTFYFCKCLYTCSTIASWEVMISMSGESCRHKSTLSPIPRSQDLLGMPGHPPFY